MIATWFPKNITIEKLEYDASLHAIQLDGERGRLGASDDIPAERLVVNYLRHQCTDYHNDQSADRHREACEAIAARFPWLAEECARQIERRRKSKEGQAADVALWEAEAEQERAQRRARVDASKEMIKRLAVGQLVSYRDRRNTYAATVEKIARSKVTISYQVKTGKDRGRLKTVHAALVCPIGAV